MVAVLINQQITVFADDNYSVGAAQRLANQWGVSLITQHQSPQLLVSNNGLSFYLAPFKPLRVDFLTGESARRVKQMTMKSLLAKAVGIKAGYRPTVIDTTAGLSIDGFCLASLGCDVTLIERSPIIAALLQDGLTRYKNNKDNKLSIKLINADATNYLSTLTEKTTDVIYLDPMYPDRKKQALGKGQLQILKFLTANDLDNTTLLFNLACKIATKRVVIKRPKHAEPLTTRQPDHTYRGTSTRFDVYFL